MKIRSDAIVRILSDNIVTDIFSPYKIQEDGESIGTGFFINNDGYILTCAHVVDSSVKIWINVPTKGKDRVLVKLHSICYDKDLAILKTIDYKNSNYCELGNSNKINTGDTVKAIGYPLGQNRLKTTKGIISGVQDRHIQTDASFNHGNSGGPLFYNDKVIGVIASKISSFIAESIGYAIPINDFILISKEMINPPKNKLIKEPHLYFEIQYTTPTHCLLFKCPHLPGCVIKRIIQNSPLYKAGVRENDILLVFDKYKLDGNGDADVEWSSDKVHLYDLITKYTVGTKISITYWSLKKCTLIKCDIYLCDDSLYKIGYTRHPLEPLNYEIFAGMIVMELSMNHLDNLNDVMYTDSTKFTLQHYKEIQNRTNSVLFISNILHGSYASSNDDIRSGLIIINVNGIHVSTLNDFREAILKHSLTIAKEIIVYMRLQDKNQIIIKVEDSFKEEKIMADRYKYKISNLYSILNNK